MNRQGGVFGTLTSAQNLARIISYSVSSNVKRAQLLPPKIAT